MSTMEKSVPVRMPADLWHDAHKAGVPIAAAAREGIAARTYGPGVLVPQDWYERVLGQLGGEGPGIDPPAVWPVDGLEWPTAAQIGRGDQGAELGDRIRELARLCARVRGAERT